VSGSFPNDFDTVDIDDIVVDTRESPAVQTSSLADASTRTARGFATASAPRPGYVACPKNGAYYARPVLKKLGGYFDPDTKLWFVPREHTEDAFAACHEGAAKNAEFTAAEVARLLKIDTADPQTPTDCCWECGGSLYEARTNAAGASWPGTSPILKTGAVIDDAYCGCVDRGDQRRRHRPDFSGAAARSTRRRY
jgi:hypothetical protein